jgi:hypothetical protein|tara:strand:- start:300 stop:920 length:621 start_codon:yes stop_codon:yes gene_type:complete
MSVTTIPTAGIANDAVDNTKLDLTSNYAFTGTVTGTSDAVLISSASGGGTGTLAFDGCFTSTYRNYLIMASISLDATAVCYIRLQNSSNQEIATNYFNAGDNSHIAAAGASGFNGGSWSVNQINIGNNILANNPHASFQLFVFNPTDSNMKTIVHTAYYCQDDDSKIKSVRMSSIYDTNSNDTGIRFVTQSGNIKTTSKFKIYGLK